MTRLPDFVVLGQGKAGTSLIYRVFEQNAQVGLSKPKELQFFNANYKKGHDWYAQHFAHIPQDTKRVGEVAPSYLKAEVVTRLHETLGAHTQVIFVLRHPIEQAYSRYLQNICAQGTGNSFDQMAAGLDKRMTVVEQAIAKCYALFGADKVLALFYERDIDVNIPGFETKICRFLDLAPADHYASFRPDRRVNAGVMPRYMFGGMQGLDVDTRGGRFHIPPGHLVFCAQPRNTKFWEDPTPDQVTDALAEQRDWTCGISADLYARLQNDLVLPQAKRLENLFGFDMDHWRKPQRAIAYDPAPPPPRYACGINP